MDLPFHIPDDIWKYLKENEDKFLKPEEKTNHKFPEVLEKFERFRHPH